MWVLPPAKYNVKGYLMKKLKIVLLGLLALSLGYFVSPSKNSSSTEAVVMITNYAKNSGGSGLIFSSSDFESRILTNAHVCEVVENGGLVTTADKAEHFIVGIKKSENHDLCFIYIRENLNHNVSVAKTSPKKYDEIKIVGHPSLYPTIITHGHMSDHKMVRVSMGTEKCDMDKEEDKDNPSCLIFGVKSITKVFDTVIVSATIMPGSSGSGVYNKNDELIGLAFAGRGDLSYGIVVPYEYLRYFLQIEDVKLPIVKIK